MPTRGAAEANAPMTTVGDMPRQTYAARARTFAAIILVLSLNACSSGDDARTLLHRYAEVDAGGWDKTDTAWIDLPQMESATRVEVSLVARALWSYPYRNLSLRTFLQVDGKTVENQRADFRLFETGDSANHQSPMFAETAYPLRHVTLPKHRRCRMGITHNMRQSSLAGITHVGVVVSLPDTISR